MIKVSGGGFLVAPCGSQMTFIPENLSDELKSLAQTTHDFSMKEVLAITDRVEESEPSLIPALLKKAGSIGLLMAEIPDNYGGLGLSKVSSTVIAENVTHQGSFSVAFLCHTGIGTLPILYYGTDEQKSKYLPKLATGEMIGAYALTEADAGSDALSGRTSAKLSQDGKFYILNGEKVFCTNGGIADLFTVFAKVDGEKFTAFIVEKKMEGVSVGKEEGKMGIHGSSTTAVILNDAKVPVENVLGEIGRGHKIAFNTLNIGRFKLGAACMGSCKRMIEMMAPQANTRHQFGQPIASFELIRQKIARATCTTYLVESLVYRYAGDLDANLSEGNAPQAIEELSIEAAVAKVLGSEALSFVADEAVQVFGGYGFIHGYMVEQEYRDARVNRIFEGTNEICRLIIPGTLIKRALSGKVKFMERLGEILAGLKTGFAGCGRNDLLGNLIDQVEAVKRLAVYVSGVAVQKLGETIKERQSVAEAIANLVSFSYAFDSGVSRAIVADPKGEGFHTKICHASLAERVPQLISLARQTLINIGGGDEKEFTPFLKALSRLIEPLAADTDKIYNEIAAKVLGKEGYIL